MLGMKEALWGCHGLHSSGLCWLLWATQILASTSPQVLKAGQRAGLGTPATGPHWASLGLLAGRLGSDGPPPCPLPVPGGPAFHCPHPLASPCALSTGW